MVSEYRAEARAHRQDVLRRVKYRLEKEMDRLELDTSIIGIKSYEYNAGDGGTFDNIIIHLERADERKPIKQIIIDTIKMVEPEVETTVIEHSNVVIVMLLL